MCGLAIDRRKALPNWLWEPCRRYQIRQDGDILRGRKLTGVQGRMGRLVLNLQTGDVTHAIDV